MTATILAREVGYKLLPFRFLRMDDTSQNNLLITAETGEYLFVSEQQLRQQPSQHGRIPK